jgi:hypothetical protein
MPTQLVDTPHKDGLGFRKEAKNLTSQKAPILAKEKGKALMASSIQGNHAFIYDRNFSRNAHYNRSFVDYNDSHAMFASSSTFVHVRSKPRRIMLCIMCLGEYVMSFLPFTMLAILHSRSYVKMIK